MTAIMNIAGLNAPQNVIKSIQHASAKTGVDFSYLVHQAKAESSFDVNAKAKTSSASGLFQFIESTWLNMTDKYGDKYGLSGLSKAQILEKRNDPKIASLMAAELAQDNKAILKAKTNVDIGATELYFAHFLGAGGASEFINARAEDGDAKAAYLFPAAAKANKGVFFNKDGSSRTLNEVYAFFDKKFEALDTSQSPQHIAQAQDISPQQRYIRTRTAPLYTQIPQEPLKAFDMDVQKVVLSSLFLEMKMLKTFRDEANLMALHTNGLFKNADYSVFE